MSRLLWDLSPPFFVLVWKVKHILQSSVKELVVSFSTTRCTRLYILKSGPPSGTHPKTLQCKKCKSDKCLRRIRKMLCIPAVRPAVVRGGPGSGLGAETGETPPLGFRLRAGHIVHLIHRPPPNPRSSPTHSGYL